MIKCAKCRKDKKYICDDDCGICVKNNERRIQREQIDESRKLYLEYFISNMDRKLLLDYVYCLLKYKNVKPTIENIKEKYDFDSLRNDCKYYLQYNYDDYYNILYKLDSLEYLRNVINIKLCITRILGDNISNIILNCL
jgi:hypothetical protein